MELVKDFAPVIALIIYYTVIEYKKLLKKKNKSKEFINSTYITIEINRLLKEIQLFTGANRVHIMTFHNTIESLTRKCYYFMDMRYEETDVHTKPVMKEMQNVPCTQFAESQAIIHQDGVLYIDETSNSKLGRYHTALGIKSAYKYRIGKSIANGVLAITWYEAGKRLNERQKQFVLNKLTELETILKY